MSGQQPRCEALTYSGGPRCTRDASLVVSMECPGCGNGRPIAYCQRCYEGVNRTGRCARCRVRYRFRESEPVRIEAVR